MSRPWLVITVVEDCRPPLQNVIQHETWEEALDTAVRIASEQCDISKNKIREELEKDLNFCYGPIWVHVLQAED